MKRVAIIGGGISGLTAAFRLEQQRTRGTPLQFVLFEAASRFGGVIKTELVENCVLEAGPDSFLTEKVWAIDLCRELGLEDQLISSNDSQRTTSIVVGGRLLQIPDGLMFMVPTRLLPTLFSPLFSWRTKLRIVGEWLRPPRPSPLDTTVATFVERHYGREIVERVADPLLAGVYGGGAHELSVQAVLPRLAEMEARHRSLGRAMVASRKSAASLGQKPLFTSLKNGMQQMVDALLARIPEATRRLSTTVEAVAPESGKWLVVTAGRRTEEFEAVILATPAIRAAELLKGTQNLGNELQGIGYSSSATVILKYDRDVRAALPPGFGFLVPRTEGRRLLGTTFVHNKFPYRVPADAAVLRCFLGGTRDPAIVDASDDEIRRIASSEIAQILEISSQPVLARIHRWNQAMAQYGLGHQERIKRVRALVAAMPGLALAGNAYAGIGVPDCIRSGSEAASKVLTELSLTQPQPEPTN